MFDYSILIWNIRFLARQKDRSAASFRGGKHAGGPIIWVVGLTAVA